MVKRIQSLGTVAAVSGLLLFLPWGGADIQDQQSEVKVLDKESSVQVDSLSYIYLQTYDRIKDVDFKNFRVRIYEDKKLQVNRQLRNGRYNYVGHGFETVTVLGVQYAETFGDNAGFAIAFIEWFYGGGSSNTDGVIQVFALSNRHLKLVQQIHWDEHFECSKGYYTYDEKAAKLIVRSARYLEGDSHCCISGMDTATFRWTGSRFEEIGILTGLSEYGKNTGKKFVK